VGPLARLEKKTRFGRDVMRENIVHRGLSAIDDILCHFLCNEVEKSIAIK